MAAAFCAASFGAKLPVGVALAVGSLAGAVAGGVLFPLDELVRHLVEGMFGYLDPSLTIASATLFMFVMQDNGSLGGLVRGILRTFHRHPVALLAGVALLIMLPGALTGSSTASVLTTGAMLAPVLVAMGVPKAKVGAILAMCAVCGMIAPPVNIPALIICAGIDMPYIGLDLTLAAMTVPLALGTTWALALPHCRAGVDPATLGDLAPASAPAAGLGAGPWRHLTHFPLMLVAALLAVEHLMPGKLHLGHPLVFLLGAGAGLMCGAPVRAGAVALRAVEASLPVLGILMGVGMFIQVMTLTGARGEIVIQSLQFPRGWTGLYPVIGLGLPLFGAVSSFGSASVLGVPMTLALPQGPSVIVIHAAALSLLAGLGDLMPPTAKAAIFAARVVDEPKYSRVLWHCVLPGVAAIAIALLVIDNSAALAPWLVRFR